MFKSKIDRYIDTQTHRQLHVSAEKKCVGLVQKILLF